MKNKNLNRLNCMNYHVEDSNGDFWYAYNGLRSLYEYSKISEKSFRLICETMILEGQIRLKDIRDNENETLVLTMI